MNVSKHTPGPWKFERGSFNGENHTSGSPGSIESESTGYVVATIEPYCHGNGIDQPQDDDANAALIAAAPDLLAALREIVADLLSGHPDSSGWYSEPIHADDVKAARAAIAKAEGGAA